MRCYTTGHTYFFYRSTRSTEIGVTQPERPTGTLPRSCKAIQETGITTDGYYWIMPQEDAMVVYCDMTTAGGGWTLCAHMGGRATGTKNWFDKDQVHPNSDVYSSGIFVDYWQFDILTHVGTVFRHKDLRGEKAWCGHIASVDKVMVEVTDLGFTDTPARVVFNWEGRSPNQLPTGLITDDVQTVSGGIKMTPMRTDSFAPLWEDSRLVCSNHTKLTNSDQGANQRALLHFIL